MKRIKSFKIFESIDNDGKLVDINNGKEIRNSIRQNDFDKFKELVVNVDKGSKLLILKNSAEYGRVEFVSYLLDLYDFTSEDIDSVITWVGHSPIAKRTTDDINGVLDILNKY